ncbi:MAG: PPC domain-containing protein [Kiritimatiellia bacterium]|nr:PPC domain-containing protein [Kiritimatiellia bacterium]
MKALRNRDRSNLLVLLFSSLVLSAVQAQQEPPHIGYLYPAGGQQGTEFVAILGGEHLHGAAVARISGTGVRAEVTEHIRPLNRGAASKLRDRMREQMDKKLEAMPRRRGRFDRFSAATTNASWSAEDEAEFADMREKLSSFRVGMTSVPALVETVEIRVTIAPDAKPGERELRLQTEFGLTRPLKFHVGQLPEVVEESGRSAAKRASRERMGRGKKPQKGERPAPGTTPIDTGPEEDTPVTLPTVLNGQILPGDVDRYRFEARKGQELIVDVSARKLIPYLSDAVPGWFQATVTLFDTNEKEVAFDDDFRFHPDPVLHYRVPSDGLYVLEIRDAIYRGREDFVYRVAVGELPYVTDIFPLGNRAGSTTAVELYGWNLPGTRMTRTSRKPGVHSVAVLKDGLLSNIFPFTVDRLPESTEKEPNNEQKTAQHVTSPLIVNGRIERPGDMDVYRFEGRAGMRIVADVKARRLGSSLDSVLRLATVDGKQLALNDDHEDRAASLTTHQADSRVNVTLPADGLYYLFVGDTQQKGGTDCGYRLHIREQKPDFELRVVPSSITARTGASIPITVHALRRDGFDGEIELALKDAPRGFRLTGGRVPAGEDAVRMTLTVLTEPGGAPYNLYMEGRATSKGRQIVRDAVPADDMTQAFVYRHLVAAKELQVAVIGRPRRFAVGDSDTAPARIPAGGTTRVRVNVPERSFLGPTELELSDPPEGITIEDVSLGRAGKEIVLRGDTTLKVGRKGNLIVNVFAHRPEPASSKGKEQRKKKRILLSALPAIPFEVVGE